MFWIGAILAVLAIHVRPGALALPIALGIAAAFVSPMNDRPRSFFRPAPGIVMLVLTVLSLLPWALRNRTVLGEWVWTSTNSGFTLYDGLNPNATGASNGDFVRRLPALQTLGEVDRSRYLAKLAADWARSNPRRVTELASIKLARFWTPVPLSEEFGGRRTYVLIAAAYAIPLFLLVVFGVFKASRLTFAAKGFLLVPAIYFSLAHAVTIGSLRYRVPVEPILAVIAASALSRSRRPAPPTGNGRHELN
jgi:hypothetical protein